MLTCILSAMIFPKILPPLFPDIPQDIILLYFFPVILLISLAGALIGTFMRPPTDDAVLKKFYKTVRPWGFWKPIHDKLLAEEPGLKKNTHFKRDMFNIFIGIICQTALMALPVFIIIKASMSLIITIGIIAVTGIILKRYWYDTLDEELN